MEDTKEQIPFLGISIKSNNKNCIWMDLDHIYPLTPKDLGILNPSLKNSV